MPKSRLKPRLESNVSEITCYNCNKKGHNAKDCFKPQKLAVVLITSMLVTASFGD